MALSNTSTKITEGKVVFSIDQEEFETYYKIVGDLGVGTPLVALHGGPGIAHDYLTSYTDLAGPTRAVVFYDQLGCGRSTHLKDKPESFWRPELFMDELQNLLDKLSIADNYALIGQSWGGMLASQFAATRTPAGLKQLIISNSPASVHLWAEATAELLKGLPEDIQQIIKKHEGDGTIDSPEYKDAVSAFYSRHLCKVQPFPEPLLVSMQGLEEDPTVYLTMNGPSEFTVAGSLKTWTIIPELHRIQVPTLILNGRYDEAQDKCLYPFFRHIPNVKWYTFAESSHMPHLEERELYMKIVDGFLTGVAK